MGLLLAREPSANEIMCDINDRLVNWWTCVRNDTDKLIDMIVNTPWARSEFERCGDGLDDPDISDVERARRFHVVIEQGRHHTDGVTRSSSWSRHIHRKTKRSTRTAWRERLIALADRIRDVTIENKSATELLPSIATSDTAVIYCDPPYPTAGAVDLYQHDSVDIGELTELLHAQRGRVAISGYNDEWDHLNWNRHEFNVFTYNANQRADRIEVLWTNYQPEHTLF